MRFQSADQDQLRETVAEHGPDESLSLPNIQKDGRLSTLFSAVLNKYHSGDAPVIEEKLMREETLEQDEINTVTDCRKKLAEVVNKGREIKAKLTPDFVREIAAVAAKDGSLGLKDLIENVGAKDLIDSVTFQLELMALEDESRYNDIVSKVEAVARRKERGEKRDKQVDELCGEYDIDRSELDDLDEITNSQKRKKEIKKLVKQRIGVWGKVKSWFTGEVDKRVSKLDTKAEIEQHINDLNQDRKALAASLNLTLGNDEVRGAYSSAMAGERAAEAKKPMSSFAEAKKEAKKFPTDEEIQDKWEVYKEEMRDEWEDDYENEDWDGVDSDNEYILIDNFEDLPDDVKNVQRDEFMDKFRSYKESKRKITGRWAEVAKVFLREYLEGKKSSLN